MATLSSQRDLVATFKKETILTVGALSKLHTMSVELSRDIFKENALEKPTQYLFNHLSHYLMSIIDSQAASGLSWPLYDTKTERAYRNGISNIILDYSNKGLLSPVMSSYLVNPGCYKVTLLLFQMSQLALQRTLLTKMTKESQKNLYKDMTEMYKSSTKEGFMESIEEATVTMSSKFSNYMNKSAKIEKIAEMMRKKITEMESKLSTLAAQEKINELVDGFISRCELDDFTKQEILNIKNVNKPSRFFDAWLSDFDRKITEMENKWNEKTSPFLKLTADTQSYTETLIARQTGEADKSTYILEFNSKTDDICTKALQSEVNSEQKYILKNIIRNDQLIFPNLIRGFLIAVSYIQKNAEHSDEIYKFNGYLDGGRRQYSDMVSAMKILLDRIMAAEAKLMPRQLTYSQAGPLKDFIEITPLPDLSDLKMGKELQSQNTYDTFTPLNVSRHQFNLQRNSKSTFAKPQSRPLLVTPFHQGPRDDFLKSLISCRVSSYNRTNTTENLNMSILSQTTYRSNETIAECSSGFTKQQIKRLLSTKKSSRYRTPPKGAVCLSKARKLFDGTSLPAIALTPVQEKNKVSDEVIENISTTLNFEDVNLSKLQENLVEMETSKTETPKNNSQLIRKTSSLEKIINRFKKVRATIVPSAEKDDEFRTIAEEKENMETFNANRILLPDLLSPNYSVISDVKKSTHYTDPTWLDTEEVVTRKPRESLGTALGVDHTFLDQFDLID